MPNKRRWKWIYGLCLFFVFPTSLWGNTSSQNSKTLTFVEALHLARNHHLSVELAREKVGQAMARMMQARSALLPQVTGTLSETRQTRNLRAQGINIPGSDPVVGPFNTFDARLRLTQAIFDATSIEWLNYDQASKDLSLAQQNKTEQDAMTLMATLYIEAERAKRRADYAAILIQRDEEALNLAKVQNQVGTGMVLDELQASANLEMSRRRFRELKKIALDAMQDLKVALDIPLDTIIVFPKKQKSPDAHLPSDAEIRQSLDSHPDIQVAKKEVNQSQDFKKIQWAEFLPKVSAKADYGVSGTNPKDAQSTYTYGAEASLPFMETGLRIGKIKEAKSRERESQLTLNHSYLKTEAKAYSTREGVLETKSHVNQAKAALAQARAAYQLAESKYDLSLGSHYDRTKASAEYTMSKDQYEEAVATYRLSYLNLIYSLGQIDSYLEKL